MNNPIQKNFFLLVDQAIQTMEEGDQMASSDQLVPNVSLCEKERERTTHLNLWVYRA